MAMPSESYPRKAGGGKTKDGGGAVLSGMVHVLAVIGCVYYVRETRVSSDIALYVPILAPFCTNVYALLTVRNKFVHLGMILSAAASLCYQWSIVPQHHHQSHIFLASVFFTILAL
jgi:hypothetical protein